MSLLKSQSRAWPLIAVVMTLVALCLLVALICVAVIDDRREIYPCGSGAGSRKSEHDSVIEDIEPDKPGPFHDLTRRELKNLRSFLESDPEINATKLRKDVPLGREALLQSYIALVDLYPPPKKDVLAFIDNNAAQPPRKALVVLFRGDKTPAVAEERICGPLPHVKACTMISSPTRRNPIEFSLRPFNFLEMKTLREVFLQGEVEKNLGYILRESFGMTYANCDAGPCLDFFTTAVGTALTGQLNERQTWVWAHYPVEYFLVHPVDFAVLVVVEEVNPAKFHVGKLWYAGRLYGSMDDLIGGYNASSIPVTRRRMPENGPELFSSIHRRGEMLPTRPQRPPQLVEPDGKRYSLSQRKVEYLGWQFHLRMSTMFGPQLYDVRFKGDRIAYEISLNEIVVLYSGHNPMHQVTDNVDSSGYLGTMVKSLVPGADCPLSATTISNTIAAQLKTGPVRFPNVWCLFEQNSGLPLRRHVGYRFVHGSFYGGMLDSHLTLRTILTVGNYDYVIDFSFHQNGVMDTRVSSTGYLMVSPYSTEESPYGYRIEDHILGNLHHHLFHFRVDLDIGGSEINRYSTLNIEQDRTKLTMKPDSTYYQTKIYQKLRRSEKDALYSYNFDKPKYHVIHNTENTTRFGELRGYSLILGGMSKQLLSKGRDNERTIPWARHQLSVTRHKEDERASTSTYAMWDSLKPVVDFSKFYDDDESIVDKDLVFWVSMGLHHIPRTEDLPLTPTTGTKLSFSISPFNYFRECPSMGSRDATRMDPLNRDKPSEGVKIQRYGTTSDSCALPVSSYDDDVEQNPDSALESSQFLGVL